MEARPPLWLLLVFCVLAYSQPANDLCSSAIQILPSDLTTSYSFSGTTANSNKEHSCPPVTGTTSPTAGDVWFYFTPSRTLLVDISLCGSLYDTYLYIASGSCSSLSCLVASDNSLSCPTIAHSNVQALPMLQGVTYYIIVSGSGSATGAYLLTVRENTGSASCASATTISSIPFISNGLTISSVSVQATPCRTGPSVWFTFVPSSTMTVKISTCSSTSEDTFLSVATGSCPDFGLSCIASNDNSPAGICISSTSPRAYLGNFQLTQGVRYFFIVTLSGDGTQMGGFRLSITPVPGNDLCSGAIPITALPASLSGDTSGTGRENTCPNVPPTAQAAGDVWFTFTPNTNVVVDVSLCGSFYDTYVYIASGSCSSLSCLISNDNGNNPPLCTITNRSYVQAFPMFGGVTYYIIVSGAGGQMGVFSLAVTASTGTTSCSLATPITDLPFSASPSVSFSSPQSSPCRTGASVWYSFTPTAPVNVSISTCSSAVSDTFLSVVTGSCPLGTLSCIATNDNSPLGGCSATSTSTRAFVGQLYPLAAGQQYFIVLTLVVPTAATGTVSISIYIPPENDICSTAIQISSTALPYTHSGDTSSANKESTCPPVTSAPDVWYSITPTADILVDVSLCGSAFDTFVYIASGSCSSISCLVSNNDNPSSGCSDATQSVIQEMPMRQGTTYFIIVTGSGTSRGAYTLTVSVNSGVASCVSATAISSVPYTSPSIPVSSSIRATPCISAASVWFTFTSSADVGVTINTCGSDFDTILSVSSGSCPFDLSCISSNDDSSLCASSTRSVLSVLVTGNVQHFINVAAKSGSGNVVLSVARNNDFCQDSTVISLNSLPFTFSGSTVGFAKNHNCLTVNGGVAGAAPDAWFSITPTSNVVVDITTCIGNYNTYLYTASGSDCSSLTCLAANDDSSVCGGTGSAVQGMPLVQGVRYFFIVSGLLSSSGSYTLSVSESTTPVSCTTSTAINSLPFTSGTVTLQVAVQSTPCRAGASVWYSYTPSFSHLATISSCNPSTATVVALSSGSCPAISCLVVNFANSACPSSRGGVVSNYLLTASTPYFITLSLPNGGSGSAPGFTMTGSSMNDGCSQATVIPTLPFSTSHSVTFATQDFSCTSGPSSLASSGADVWYSFTPSTDLALVAISTCSSLSRFGIYVASGSCSSRECVQSDSSSCPSGGSGYLEMSMQSGTRYFIAVSAFTASPAFQLTVSVPTGPGPTIRCPADVTRVAIRSTCVFPGATGTPVVGGSGGTVSKSPLPPYPIGITEVTYTITSTSDPDLSASCVQRVTITRPTGNFCN